MRLKRLPETCFGAFSDTTTATWLKNAVMKSFWYCDTILLFSREPDLSLRSRDLFRGDLSREPDRSLDLRRR